MNTRRDFIKTTAVASAGLSLASAGGLLRAPDTVSATSSNLAVRRLQADLAIVGGGMAGVCAALAAARNGARVVLAQDRPVLGGNASSEVKMHIVGADCHGARAGTRESGIIEELRLDDAARNPHRCFSQWDLLLYEKVKLEPNITLLLDTTCVSCVTAGGRIQSLTALRNISDDVFEISASFFADCSGDGRLAVEAGADVHTGREAKAEFNESLARDVADRHTLGSSIMFTGRRLDTPQPFIAPSWARQFTKDDFKHRPINSYEYGYWWLEWGGQLDTIKDHDAIRHELLRIALGVWDYIKNSGAHPKAANWALDWVAPIPARRESRRLLGPHILTQHDVQGGKIFDDAVAYGGWAMDIHPPEGMDVPGQPPFTPTGLAQVYTIPFRALRSRNIANLLCAGRNISATHVAFASARVMATCAVEGQAIGTAAAFAVRDGRTLADLDIPALQQQLLKDDAYIPALNNSDPADHARRASVSASSQQDAAPAAAVIDGVARDLIGQWGAWADQRPHHWASTQLPAWLELDLGAPVTVSEVHLTFDSGFQRELTLSAGDWATTHCVRGPQPETVRDYQLYADGELIVEEHGNWLRKRVHKFPRPLTVGKLRLHITATNGHPHARVFEVRVY
ncbi:MAG: FAD-dependent oxidoreductase [Verrucomicrobiales bacterium]|jgi:hypothetical protein|nr:FAD-dependent oxidoreductase [Verrucomicrobiales bacterium]